MDDSHKRIAHNDCVEIRRGKSTRQMFGRLVRKTTHALQTMEFTNFFDPGLFAAASDKHEDDIFSISQTTRGFQQRIKWVAGTMISRIHNDEALRELMLPAK